MKIFLLLHDYLTDISNEVSLIEVNGRKLQVSLRYKNGDNRWKDHEHHE